MISIYRTLTFIASCLGVLVCIAAMFMAKAFGRPDYMLVFVGNGLLCAMGASVHWYLDRKHRLTQKRPRSTRGS